MSLSRIITVLTLIAGHASSAYAQKCSELLSYAHDAYAHSQIGSSLDVFERVRYHAKKTMSVAEGAISASKTCDCYGATQALEDVYDRARMAYLSDDLDQAVFYLRRTRLHADNAVSLVSACARQSGTL